MIGAGISEEQWLAAKRAEVLLLGFKVPENPADLFKFGVAPLRDESLRQFDRLKPAQPNYDALGITDPEGQN